MKKSRGVKKEKEGEMALETETGQRGEKKSREREG